MNEDTVKGNWMRVSGKIRQKWGKLADDNLMKAEGDKDFLLGMLQEHDGLAKDKAEPYLKDLGHCMSRLRGRTGTRFSIVTPDVS